MDQNGHVYTSSDDGEESEYESESESFRIGMKEQDEDNDVSNSFKVVPLSGWPQSFSKSMDIYSSSSPLPNVVGLGSYSFEQDSVLRSSSFHQSQQDFEVGVGFGVKDSNGCLKEPLLQNRNETRGEEFQDGEKSAHCGIDHGVSGVSEESYEGISFIRASVNGMNVLAGVGILSTPYALSHGGWMGLGILFLFAMICCYTGFLLKRCMEVNKQILSYPDIGQIAFGHYGRIITSIFLYLELYSVAVEFLILEGDNLAQLFPNMAINFSGISLNTHQSFVILASLVILPTVWLRNLSLLSYVSAGGVVASIVVVLAVAWVGVFDGVGFLQQGSLLNLNGLPTSIGLYAFCYCGHAVFPNIYSSMKDRQQFSWVLIFCFIVCTLIYGSIAVMGYLMFGNQLLSQVTLNLPRGKLASKVAIYTTLINPFTKYALTLTPLCTALEEFMPASNASSKSTLLLLSTCIRTLLLVSTVVVALTVPLFGYLMALIGSLLSCTVSFILPSIFYLKIFRAKVSIMETIIVLMILVLGILTCFVGTYSSLQKIADNI